LDKKARDVSILDLRGRVDYADIFILCTASNARQTRAIAESVRSEAKAKCGLNALSTEGFEQGKWVLVDFGDIILHVFDDPMRSFYNIDSIWTDAKRLAVPDVEPSEDATPLLSLP
jgi:ribosome-associated protein